MSISGFASAASQTWYLETTAADLGTCTTSTTTGVYHCGMIDAPLCSGSCSTVNQRIRAASPCSGGGIREVIWLTDERASASVDFGSDAWTLMATVRAAGGTQLTAALGSIALDGTFTAVDSDTKSASSSTATFTLDPPSNFVVPQSSAVAVKMSIAVSCSVDVRTDAGRSHLTSPASSPAYPTPELGAFILGGVGLVAVASVAIWGRRQGSR